MCNVFVIPISFPTTTAFLVKNIFSVVLKLFTLVRKFEAFKEAPPIEDNVTVMACKINFILTYFSTQQSFNLYRMELGFDIKYRTLRYLMFLTKRTVSPNCSFKSLPPLSSCLEESMCIENEAPVQ